jgi:hypothetical protein
MTTFRNMRLNNKLAVATFAAFSFFLVVGLLFSELYQAPLRKNSKLKKYSMVLTMEEVFDLKSIKINNEQGNFNIQKSPEGDWALTSPKEFLVNSHLMQKMLEELANLKILSLIEADTINLNNYLLNDSRRSITLTNIKDEEFALTLGMSNTINNSTYIYLPARKIIYQIESPQIAFANLDLALLIENRVFQLQASEVVDFNIYNGSLGKQDLRLGFDSNKGKWKNKKGQELGEEKVMEFLQKTFNTKSFFILDQVSNEQETELNRYFSQPSHEITVKMQNQEDSMRYTISTKTKSLKNLDLPEESVFIKQSKSKLVYVVSVKNLDFLDVKDGDLKPLPLKKLFY